MNDFLENLFQPPPHYRFHYDPEVKGWRETQKVTATTRWNKAKDAVRVGNYVRLAVMPFLFFVFI